MSKQDWQQNNLTKIFTLPRVSTILDVACGLSLRSKFIPADVRVGVDIYDEYFKHIEAEVPYAVVKHDVRNLSDIFMPKSFDLVIALDIVEHLEKEEALEMIRQCEEIAKIAVIIETPEGYIPQDIDILGHGGHKYQTHRSGWEVDEFKKMGYNVITRPYEMTDVKRHSKLSIDNLRINLIDALKYV